VQYAHARLCSIARQASELGISGMTPQDAALNRLRENEEYALLKTLADYPRMVAGAATDLEPHRVIFYLMDLAARFHGFYNKHKVLGDDPELSRARLFLCGAWVQGFQNGLQFLGVAAPESM
ncbi:arginine--tRNA ligase, partial [Desulfobulbus rhabdoformis]|uniref:DALR anticodon-binding domain-containing protein n=1 Tax=Desulfobulbus rhabdoformis TaxID=34032 RepID=UPI0023DD3C2B